MDDVDLTSPPIPVLGFVGYSGAGKTTLLAKVISELAARGIRTAVIKHAHHQLDIDRPGKDSFVLRHAGAVQTIVASKRRWALMVETPSDDTEPQLGDLVRQLNAAQLDLILVEGFKHAHYPKLEIHRGQLNKPLLYPEDPDIIALVSDDETRDSPAKTIPVLKLDDTKQIVQFILQMIRNQND